MTKIECECIQYEQVLSKSEIFELGTRRGKKLGLELFGFRVCIRVYSSSSQTQVLEYQTRAWPRARTRARVAKSQNEYTVFETSLVNKYEPCP